MSKAATVTFNSRARSQESGIHNCMADEVRGVETGAQHAMPY